MAIDTHTEPPDVHPTPGVSYSPATGRAYVGDTGIQVFQIITTWHEVGHDRLALVTAYHWLTYDDLVRGARLLRAQPGDGGSGASRPNATFGLRMSGRNSPRASRRTADALLPRRGSLPRWR
ncbi:MAG: hypothetical protein U0531_05805 [Dehalococcoidia bacterium]